MGKLDREIKKLSPQEYAVFSEILEQIKKRDRSLLDIKKLKGYKKVYRVRKGNLRVIFMENGNNINLLAVRNRSEKTYRDF